MALPPPPLEKSLTSAVQEFLRVTDQRVAARSLSPATADNYRVDLLRFLELLPRAQEHTAESVTGEDVDAVLTTYAGTADHRRKPLPGQAPEDPRRRMARTPEEAKSSGSTLRMRRSLSSFFGFCVQRRWATVSPLAASELVPRGREPLRVERTSLSLEEAQALLAHGPGDERENPHHRRDLIALALMAVVGLRAGELVRVRAQELLPATAAGPARLAVRGKGRSARTVPVPDWVAQEIAAYRRAVGPQAPSELLLSATGRPLAVRDVERLVQRAVARTRRADPQHARAVVPHGLRHTAATLMLAEGWDVKVVGRLLGHRSAGTTSRYLDDLPGELEAALASHPLAPRPSAVP